MSSFFSTAGLARISARRPWIVVGAWVLALVVAIGLSSAFLGDALTVESTSTNNPESVKGIDTLDESGLETEESFLTETVVVQSDRYTIDSPEFQQVVADTTAAPAGHARDRRPGLGRQLLRADRRRRARGGRARLRRRDLDDHSRSASSAPSRRPATTPPTTSRRSRSSAATASRSSRSGRSASTKSSTPSPRRTWPPASRSAG